MKTSLSTPTVLPCLCGPCSWPAHEHSYPADLPQHPHPRPYLIVPILLCLMPGYSFCIFLFVWIKCCSSSRHCKLNIVMLSHNGILLLERFNDLWTVYHTKYIPEDQYCFNSDCDWRFHTLICFSFCELSWRTFH